MSRLYLGFDKIKDAVCQMARQITDDYKGEELVVVGLLKGSFIFMADLIRKIDVESLYTDFMMVTSFKDDNTRDKEIKVVLDLNTSICDKNVLLVEDIVDTGKTFEKVLNMLKSRNPKTLRTCVLLDKSCCREVDVPIDYCGFEIEDDFVFGYGLDNCQKERNIDHIRAI